MPPFFSFWALPVPKLNYYLARQLSVIPNVCLVMLKCPLVDKTILVLAHKAVYTVYRYKVNINNSLNLSIENLNII